MHLRLTEKYKLYLLLVSTVLGSLLHGDSQCDINDVTWTHKSVVWTHKSLAWTHKSVVWSTKVWHGRTKVWHGRTKVLYGHTKFHT